MIEVKDVQKTIDGTIILKDISFTIKKGSIVGLLGRNGVGKTTLLKLLTTILLPDQGSIHFNGLNVVDNPKIKERIAFVPDVPVIISQYKVNELISFYERIYPEFDKVQMLNLMERYNLPRTQIRSYSKGMKALISILLAFCTKAEYIILDEPTSGLDPIIKRQVLQFIIDEVSNSQATVIISTHHLDEVEKIADTIMIINQQHIESVTSLDEVKEQFQKVQVAFSEEIPKEVMNLDNVTIISQVGKVNILLIQGETSRTLEKIKATKPLLLEVLPMSLEDIFVATLGGEENVV